MWKKSFHLLWSIYPIPKYRMEVKMNTQLFYKAMSGFYDLLDVIYFRKYESSPRKVVYKAINDNDKILDLCTGTATNAINIAKKKQNVKVAGVDISEDMLTIAKFKVKEEELSNVKLYCMDAATMKFKDKCFDKVLISLVLHEIDEEVSKRIINEAIRVLKPGGEIIVTEWERSNEIWKKILFLPIELLEPKPYRTFVVKDLHKYFSGFGLQVVKEEHCDFSKVLRLKKYGE